MTKICMHGLPFEQISDDDDDDDVCVRVCVREREMLLKDFIFHE